MKKQLRGYIRNLPDKSVEVVAELIDDDVESILEVLKEGSPASSVDDIKYSLIDDSDLIFDGFEIRYEE